MKGSEKSARAAPPSINNQNKSENSCISTIDAPPGVPGVSKDGPGSTKHAS